MKGFIARTAAGACVAGGLFAATGCYYRDIVDPCWPERYTALSRSSVRESFFNQSGNGHVLDQTVWNWQFCCDKDGAPTDTLDAAGMEHLNYISRRRPAPDLHVFLQTAQDIPYMGDAEKTLAARQALDQRRVQVVQAYLTTQLAPRGIAGIVDVAVIDPTPVGIFSPYIAGTLPPGRELPIIGARQKLQYNFQGVLPGSMGAGSATGGSSGGGSSGGGGGGASGGGGGGGMGAGR